MAKHLTHHERIYLTFNYPGSVSGSKTLLTGIRKCGKTLYITGWYEPPNSAASETISFLYTGDIRGITGPYSDNKYNVLNYPSAPGRTVKMTNLYGPDVINDPTWVNAIVRAVGNYTTEEAGNATIGCMYEGPLDGSGTWTTLTPDPDAINTIAHSTMGGLVVGNYDKILIQGKAFIYDVNTKTYYEITKPNSKSITAYGIWHNKGNWYTICGGFSNVNPISGLDAGYLVDWNNKTHQFSNWREYYYRNDNVNSIITHFDGITSDGCGGYDQRSCHGSNYVRSQGYNLVGDAIALPGVEAAFFAHVNRHCDYTFSEAKWEEIKFPGFNITSGNSVAKDTVIGVYTNPVDPAKTVNGYISIVI